MQLIYGKTVYPHNTKTKLMETEKIISTIKQQIGTTDFSDRPIGKYVELNPVADGQEPDEAYFNRGSEFFKSLQGQYNADFSAKLNTQVEEFKKNYKPEVEKKVEPDSEPSKGDGDKRYQELVDKYSKLEERLNEKEKSEAQTLYRKNLYDKFKDEISSRHLQFDPVYYKAIELEHGDFDTSKNVSDVISEIIPTYEKMFTDNNRDGAIPFAKEGMSGKNEGNKVLDSFFAKKADEGMMPKKE